MATRSAFEVEPRLPASSLLLWASPAQAKQTLLQKRRRVDAPCVGFPSRRARVQAEPTSCRRSECGWAAGRPVAGARHAVRRRCGSQGERLWLAKKVERGVSQIRSVSQLLPPLPTQNGLVFAKSAAPPRLAHSLQATAHTSPPAECDARRRGSPSASSPPAPPRHRVADRRPARRPPLCADRLCARSVAAARRRGAQAGRGALRAGVRVGGRGDADLDRRQRLGAGLGLLLQAAEAARRRDVHVWRRAALPRVAPPRLGGGRAGSGRVGDPGGAGPRPGGGAAAQGARQRRPVARAVCPRHHDGAHG